MSKEQAGLWLRGKLEKLGKLKFPILILLLGAALALLSPTGKKSPPPSAPPAAEEQEALQDRLEALLSQVEGAGKVKVLLTLKAGPAYIYQTDEQAKNDGGEQKNETVIVSAAGGGEQAVTKQTVYPTYMGAVVVCQGADSAAVRLDIQNAVSSLTGLGSDKITVIKMKSKQ